MAEDFSRNLMKMMVAELYFLIGMEAAREMYGKSYFALGVVEKGAVDQAVLAAVGSNYRVLTPELLAAQADQQPMGFQAPTVPPKPNP